jgi:ATP-binding cassette subfamily B protein
MKKTIKKKSVNRFHQFFKWMKGNAWLFFIAVVLLIALQFFRTLVPLFMQYVMVLVEEYNNGTSEVSTLPLFMQQMTYADTLQRQLVLVAVVFLLFALFRVMFMIVRRIVNGIFMERVAYKMRNTLYKKIQDLSFSYHTHAETGDLIQRCTTDVDQYRMFVGEQLIEVFRLIFLVGFTIYQMLRMNVAMTLVSVAITPVIFIITFVYFMKVKSIFKKVEEAEGKMTTTLQESVTGIRVVKAFAKEKHEIERFEIDSTNFLNEDYRLLKVMSIFWSSTDFIIFLQYALALSFGLLFTSRGDISAPQFATYLVYVGMVVWPMRQLGRVIGDFGKTIVSLDRLDEIMLPETEHVNDTDNKPEIIGKVEFKNVGFQFEDDNKQLLKDISFTVEKGETVAIVGRTGSGKSTLINLMVRLLENQKGSIMFDGTDIKDINKKHLRQHVGIIMQEPFLFSRSVYENIKIMDKNAEQDKVYNAASIASVHSDIVNFERGYETIVGERGVTLSGGQKQRVAIARMLLDSKPVLIFDDSLSAVDTETDIQIRNALNEYWKKTTVFIITHRITTAMEADKIIVLDKGEVAEMGTHDELLKRDGIYNDLWDIQTNIQYDYNKLDKEGE